MSRLLLRALALAPLAVLASGAAHAQLLHRYSFDGSGTTIVDSAGAADGVALGGAAVTGTGKLALDGLDDYVELPGGLLAGLDAASFEAWYTWTPSPLSAWQRVMDFGSSSGGPGAQGTGVTYLVISPRAASPTLVAGALKTPSAANSAKVYSVAPSPQAVPVHVVLTLDSAADTFTLYVDGALQNVTTVSENLSELDDVNNWLGRSQFINDPYFAGSLDEFRVHAGALTPAQVMASFAAGPDSAGVGTRYCGPASVNSTGASAVMGASGSAVVASDDLVLEAAELPMSSFGFFLTSRTQGFVANPGGSQGNLCLGGAIGRYVGPGQVQNSGAPGAISLPLALGSTPTPTGFVQIAPGETWSFQAWYRDAVSGAATSNFTDGLEVTFL